MPVGRDARLRIVAHGRLDVFEPGGAYQLYVTAIQPAGFGDLAIRFDRRTIVPATAARAIAAHLRAHGWEAPARERLSGVAAAHS